MRYKKPLILTIAALVVVLLCIYTPAILMRFAFGDGPPRRGNALETWETTNNRIRIRLTAYEERGAYLAGTYYGFESAPETSTAGKEFMVFRHDDRPEIPREQVRFVSDKVAYVFMGWMYAVTTDGGVNWFVWNAQNDLANWQCCNYGLIKDVNISADGKGRMILNVIPGRRGEVAELCTIDFGQHRNEPRNGV